MALLTLDEAKQQLNITGTSQDAELQVYIDGLTAAIEKLVGPVEVREVTEVVGNGGVLCLSRIPAVALMSFVPLLADGQAVAVDEVVLDGPSGLVRRLDGAGFRGGPWRVTYTAGRDAVPPSVNLAARMLLQHLWRTQSGGSRNPMFGGDDMAAQVPGFGYAIPNRVLQLLDDDRLPPGVA